jgi:sensor histidine kinase YesM
MVFLGQFKRHDYEFKTFMKQGLLVVFAGLLYLSISIFNNHFQIQSTGFGINILLLLIFGFGISGIFVVILVFLTERALMKKNSHFFLEILIPFFSIPLSLVFLLLVMYLSIKIWFPKLFPGNLQLFILSSLRNIISISLFIGFVRAIFIYLRLKSENIIRKKDLELALLSERHKQAELQSLRAKINPHFLYNSLNSIASLSTTDAQKTEKMALALSDFFKYSINREQNQLNLLSEELNAISTYLEIEKVRFGDRLSFEISCPADLLNIQIPQLLVQPLVENAIKHGLSQITGSGLIRIMVFKVGSLLKIRVYDNGPAFPDEPLSGYGLQNTLERISLQYGPKATINWQNLEEKFVEISIPVQDS